MLWLGFGISVLLLAVFLIFPLLNNIKKGADELVSVKKDLVLLKDKTSGLEEIKKTYEDWGIDFNKIEELFVDPEIPVDLMEFLEKTAINSGNSINISPVSLRTDGTDLWDSIAFQLDVTGPCFGFLKFLQKIESCLYLIEIKELNIKKLSEQELKLERYEKYSLGDVGANLVIKVFTK